MRRHLATDGRGRAWVLLEPTTRVERMRGLLAIGPPPRGVAMLLRGAHVVHTVGMTGSLLVAFLDADLTVRATRVVARGKLVGPVRGASHVLEAAPTPTSWSASAFSS